MGRRHLITAITMLALCGILVLGAVTGWRSMFAEVPSIGGESPDASPSEDCITKRLRAGQQIRSEQVRVSVFNSGDRDGLADSTLRALKRRGFVPGDVGNAPADTKVQKAEVWSTEADYPEARLVARQLGRKVRVRFADDELGVGVDVIVGDGFTGLVKAPRRIKVREPAEICVSSGGREVKSQSQG